MVSLFQLDDGLGRVSEQVLVMEQEGGSNRGRRSVPAPSNAGHIPRRRLLAVEEQRHFSRESAPAKEADASSPSTSHVAATTVACAAAVLAVVALLLVMLIRRH